MPKEEKEKQELAPEQESQPAKKSKGPLLLIIVAVGVFIVGVGGFSVMMGVFSATPSADTPSAPDSLASNSVPIDSVGAEQEELAAMEKKIFGEDDVVNADNLDDLAQASEHNNQPDNTEENYDSIATVNWLKTEKAKLAKERAELDKMKKDIEAREVHLKQLISQTGKIEKERISDLAKLYEGMKAEQVAPLITQLSDEQAVQILLSMKSSHAAKILGAISPDRAARISNNMINLNKEK